TAYFLADTVPWYPAGTAHVIVVDPGVGTERDLLCVEWHGQHVLAPDNGCWTSLIAEAECPIVHRLAERRYWRPAVSATFHGRDILAPVAGHLTLGVPPSELGPSVTNWRRLSLPRPTETPDGVRGQVVIVDRFGNLISNVAARAITAGAVIVLPGGTTVKMVG